MNKEEISESLLNILKNAPDQEFQVQELADDLMMTRSDRFKMVVQSLAQLEREKKVTLNQNGAFTIAKDDSMKTVVGEFHATDRGFGFVSVDPDRQDYFINPTQTMAALNGDQVEVAELKAPDPTTGRGPEGKIVAIVEHALTKVVGEFMIDQTQQYSEHIIGEVKLKDKKLSHYRFLVNDKGLHPVAGEVILAQITSYPDSHLPGILKGIAVKIIGNVNDPGMDILQIVFQHDLPTAFPQEVMDQVAKIPDEVTAEQKIGRRDLTDQQLVTIDSIESKDLDDAVTAWKLPNGNYHLGVHIADVSHYVVLGTPLDDEAFSRGTSVYLADRVIPMLPPKLSNGICSLNPHVERLAMSCDMEINSLGQVVKHEIFPSVIKTTERMTYKAVNNILEAHDEKTMNRYHDLVPMFETMAELHKVLEKMRHLRGAIEFEDDEAQFILDKNGHPLDIVLRHRGIGEKMVESFMLAANETVAAHFRKLNVPFIYRIHENPKPEKMMNFFEVLSSIGIQVKGSLENVTPKMLQGILKKVAGKPEETMVSTLLLRSMQQAKYAPDPIGHFGLAATDYTHFTSPIRRYPDLLVHRLIKYYTQKGVGETAQAVVKDKIPAIALHSSQMERKAVDSERDTDALKKAEYMADRIGDEFDAIVSSVTKFGLFIALPNTVEGLVHISEMHDDFYEFLEKQLALVGKKTKRTFRIGQPVRVKLLSVDVDQKEVNFKILNPQDAPKTDLLKKYGTLEQNKKFNNHNHNRGHGYKKSFSTHGHGFKPFKGKFKNAH
jgi:ribonuclease R